MPSGGLYATYHLLREPETTIDRTWKDVLNMWISISFPFVVSQEISRKSDTCMMYHHVSVSLFYETIQETRRHDRVNVNFALHPWTFKVFRQFLLRFFHKQIERVVGFKGGFMEDAFTKWVYQGSGFKYVLECSPRKFGKISFQFDFMSRNFRWVGENQPPTRWSGYPTRMQIYVRSGLKSHDISI